jgi:hypothetical protein
MQGHGNPKFIKEAVTTELYQLKQFIKKKYPHAKDSNRFIYA